MPAYGKTIVPTRRALTGKSGLIFFYGFDNDSLFAAHWVMLSSCLPARKGWLGRIRSWISWGG